MCTHTPKIFLLLIRMESTPVNNTLKSGDEDKNSSWSTLTQKMAVLTVTDDRELRLKYLQCVTEAVSTKVYEFLRIPRCYSRDGVCCDKFTDDGCMDCICERPGMTICRAVYKNIKVDQSLIFSSSVVPQNGVGERLLSNTNSVLTVVNKEWFERGKRYGTMFKYDSSDVEMFAGRIKDAISAIDETCSYVGVSKAINCSRPGVVVVFITSVEPSVSMADAPLGKVENFGGASVDRRHWVCTCRIHFTLFTHFFETMEAAKACFVLE